MSSNSSIQSKQENLIESINDRSINIDNILGISHRSKEFSFFPIFGNSEPLFSVEINKKNIKQEGETFQWYRNRNLPQISVQSKKKHLKKEKQYLDGFQIFVGASFTEGTKMVSTNILGKNQKNGFKVEFNSLKFEKTSYILNGSFISLMVIIATPEGDLKEAFISNPIYVTSWKNYLQDTPSKSAIFSPFLPIHLSKLKVVESKNSDNEEEQQLIESDTMEKPLFNIIDNLQGLSDYFKGSTIKQKICHPLFLSILFSKTVNLYVSNELVPSYTSPKKETKFKKDLLINVQKYFINCLSSSQAKQSPKIVFEIKRQANQRLDDKVRNFLNRIFSECIQLVSKDEEINLFQKENYFLFSNQEDTEQWIQAYKCVFGELESFVLQSKNQDQLSRQQEFYQQSFGLRRQDDKLSLSSTLYSIPRVQISLNRQYVDQDKMIEIPVIQLSSHYPSRKRSYGRSTIVSSELPLQKKLKINSDTYDQGLPAADSFSSTSTLINSSGIKLIESEPIYKKEEHPRLQSSCTSYYQNDNETSVISNSSGMENNTIQSQQTIYSNPNTSYASFSSTPYQVQDPSQIFYSFPQQQIQAQPVFSFYNYIPNQYNSNYQQSRCNQQFIQQPIQVSMNHMIQYQPQMVYLAQNSNL